MKEFIRYLLAICDRFPLSIILYRFIQNEFFRGLYNFIIFWFAFLYYCIVKMKCIFLRKKNSFQIDFAIVVIIKNEAPYINEWIEYHRRLGVDKFIIYDNESTDEVEKVLTTYIQKGIVDYRIIKGKQRQKDAYNDALCRYYKVCELMAFIDADEFIFAKTQNFTRRAKELIFADKNIGGLVLNWQIYGSSGFEKSQGGFVTKTFLYRAVDTFKINNHVKSVVNPRKVLAFRNPHYPIYLKKCKAVNSRGQVVNGSLSEDVDYSECYIKHYFTKSREEFFQKRLRGMADNLQIRDISEFEKYDKNDIYDDEMITFWDSVSQETDEIKNG